MIASLRGTVVAMTGTTAVIEVGGVGYAVAVTPRHALALREGETAIVHTALIVRDDELALCGFSSRDELEVFELLRGVTGVGPKSALGVLAVMSPEDVAVAVAAEDDGAFRAVPGIGPKTAKLIAVSLAGRLVAPRRRDRPADGIVQARVALEGLGWPERRVSEVMSELDIGEDAPVPEILRLALARLGPTGAR